MRHTEDRLTYILGSREARRVLSVLERQGLASRDQVRRTCVLHPQAFLRVVHRLALFDLVRLRPVEGAEWREHGIRAVLELTPRGRGVVRALHDVDKVLLAHRGEFGTRSVELLTEAA